MDERNMNEFTASLIAGGCAGTAVDTALFPLDTVKTRLQSAQGFIKSGGFRGIYNGLSSAVIGSAPGAAAFFSTYEFVKKTLKNQEGSQAEENNPVHHMMAAASGETMACLVRVPTELVKQKMQASTGQRISAPKTVRLIIKQDGFLGMYRGFFSTVVREIPFSVIQFPLYEFFKVQWSLSKREKETDDPVPLKSWEGAVCGSVGGAISAAITTPLDVIKTRIMLEKDANGKAYNGYVDTFQRIWREDGPKRLYSGIVPRTMWISIGGFIFFGVYEQVRGSLLV